MAKFEQRIGAIDDSMSAAPAATSVGAREARIQRSAVAENRRKRRLLDIEKSTSANESDFHVRSRTRNCDLTWIEPAFDMGRIAPFWYRPQARSGRLIVAGAACGKSTPCRKTLVDG
jgi:hypothetical protein